MNQNGFVFRVQSMNRCTMFKTNMIYSTKTPSPSDLKDGDVSVFLSCGTRSCSDVIRYDDLTNKYNLVPWNSADMCHCFSPLMLCVLGGQKFWDLIGECKIDWKVNQVSENQWSSLTLAIEMDEPNLVKMLLDMKADVNVNKPRMNMYLGRLASNSQLKQKERLILGMLLEKGLHLGDTSTIFEQACMKDNVELAYILAGHSKIERVSFVRTSNIQIASLLVSMKTDINQKSWTGCSPLYLATRDDNLRMMQFLIDNGAVLDSADHRGDTPLMIAKSENATRLLLKHRASIRIENQYKDNFITLALKNKSPEIFKMVIDQKVDVNEKLTSSRKNISGSLLLKAIRLDRFDHVKVLIQTKADVNEQDDLKWTPLMHSVLCKNGHAMIPSLIQGKASIDAMNHRNKTALHIARRASNPKTWKTLVECVNHETFLVTKECLPFPIDGGHHLLHLLIVSYVSERIVRNRDLRT